MKQDFAPLRGPGVNTTQNPWEGSDAKKPWEYKVTVAIPLVDTYETVTLCVDLLRLQTEKPYIILVDTGSCGDYKTQMETLQDEDCEVHFLRLNGVQHPSDFPAMAMDVAFALCRTDFLFATHADCFLRKRTFLAELLDLCRTKAPVVGYEMSPRAHSDWHGMVSHTATMYHMPTMDKIGFAWSLRRLCNMYNIKDYKPTPLRPNWPDTEILGNYILRHQKIQPLLIGHEKNFAHHVDENIDHLRSYTSGKLYSPPYFKQASEWFDQAKKDALVRIEEWKKLQSTEERSIERIEKWKKEDENYRAGQ